MDVRRSAILVGMGLGLGGLALALTRASVGAPETGLLLAGLGAFGFAVLGRSTGRGNALNLLLTLLYVAFWAGSVAFLFLLARPRLPEVDLTSARLNTLNPLSRKWIATLDRPIHLVAFAAGDRNDGLRREFDRLRDLNARISYEFLDPLRDSVRALAYDARVYPGDVFVESGTRRRRINVLEGIREGELINALVAVTLEGPTTLYFLAGHGEAALTPAPKGDAGVDHASILADNLQRRGYDVKPLDLSATEGGRVPPDAMAVVALAPDLPLRAPETAALGDYLRDGGRVIVAIGLSGISPGEAMHVDFAGWKTILREMGVELLDELVVDLRGRELYGTEMMAVPSFERGGRPVRSDDPELGGVGFLNSRAMRRVVPVPAGLETRTLVASSATSFRLPIEGLLRGAGQHEVSGDDAASEPLLVESRRRHPSGERDREGRLLVFASALPFVDAAGNAASLLLFVRSIEDMTSDRRAAFLPIPDRRLPDQLLAIAPRTMQFLLILHLLFIPGCIFFGGLGLALARRDVR